MMLTKKMMVKKMLLSRKEVEEGSYIFVVQAQVGQAKWRDRFVQLES